MTAGSALGVVAVVAWSQVQQVWHLYAAFVLIGLASAASLYEAALPVVIAAARPGRRNRYVVGQLVGMLVGVAAVAVFYPDAALAARDVVVPSAARPKRSNDV